MSPAAPAQPRLLILDDDRAFARSLGRQLAADGFALSVAATPGEADALLNDAPHELAIVEPAAAGRQAEQWLHDVHRAHRDLAIVLLSVASSCATAVPVAARLVKPVTPQRLRAALDAALQRRHLVASPDRNAPPEFLGRDRRMLKLLELADAVAAARSTVLLGGESGTGKSLLARVIHQRSPRRHGPFVEFSCGSLPETLLESELFGHVKGAFTGAVADKIGRFEAADGGTIFLDEIDSASPSMQVKLLRVLQDRSFEPVGSSRTRTADARVIVASNRDLSELVARGAFRQDLFYRVSVLNLQLPALRERPTDVPMLAEHFLLKASRESGRQVIGFSHAATRALQAYAWPGNVRELENVVERAAVLSRDAVVDLDDLPPAIASTPHTAPERPAAVLSLEAALLAPERAIVEAALHRNNWCRQATARELGIDRTTLYKKMRKHGL